QGAGMRSWGGADRPSRRGVRCRRSHGPGGRGLPGLRAADRPPARPDDRGLRRGGARRPGLGRRGGRPDRPPPCARPTAPPPAAQPAPLLLGTAAVRPSARGRGIGARLLAFAEDQARALGRDEIRLYTNEAMTENLAYYPRHGYTETHRAEQDGFRRVFFRKRLTSR